ncbi:hypothetical protein C8J57DRAFT_1507059 [Mycena rebaudengoi]|nr:hypothetical protein C8J57DRAFT_1507059 [Mycena rebaudengoi]
MRPPPLTHIKCDAENCGFYRWIPPPSPTADDPYAINPGQGPGDNNPFPPSEVFRSPTFPTPQIDPALCDPSPSSTSASASPLPPSLAPEQTKPKCLRDECKRLATASGCTHRFCKSCCQAQNTGCNYAPHRKSSPTLTVNGNPSALARPPAVIPTQSTSSLSLPIDNLDLSLAPKIYCKPMDDAWATQYRNIITAQQKRKDEEEERRIEARRLQNQIEVWYFAEDNQEPDITASKTSLRFHT